MEKEFKLDMDKLEREIIPEFSVLFSNPREMKLFKNFILYQAHIKNKFFKLLSEKKEEAYSISLLGKKIKSMWSSEIEGQFAYLYYSIFILPGKASQIFLYPESFFNMISDKDLEIRNGFSKEQLEDAGKVGEIKVKEFLEKKDSSFKKLLKLRDVFRKYYPEKEFILSLFLQNNIQSLIDISKVDSIFSSGGDIRSIEDLVKKEFGGDWKYLFIILKKKIISELPKKYEFYKYYSLFAEGAYWNIGETMKNITENQMEMILDFFNEMIQFPEFLNSICETIVSHITPESDFLLFNEFKTFGKFKLYHEIGDIAKKNNRNNTRFKKMMNIILGYIFSQIETHINTEESRSEFIYRLSFYLNSVLRMFPMGSFDLEMSVSNPEINKALFFGGVFGYLKDATQENLVNYSYYLLNFKFQLQKINENEKKILYYRLPKDYIHLKEQEVFGVITNLFRKHPPHSSRVVSNVTLEATETLLFMVYLKNIKNIKSINKAELKKILIRIRNEFWARNFSKELQEKSKHLFINPKRDDEIIKLTIIGKNDY